MRVLLLSAYAAVSHVQWQRNLQVMFPDWHWQVLSLPPRHFSWRIRGNPLHWALEERELLELDYDLLLATSMVDLATLRGLVPALASLPTALYFHENQFAYPQADQRHGLLEAQMVSLYAALAADAVLFNSAYNRDSFLDGCKSLLDRLPDFTPASCQPALTRKASVLPVPLALAGLNRGESWWPGQEGDYPRRPLRLLWSGRFEYDKGGEGLLALLQCLEDGAVDYEIAMTGQQFRSSPPVFEQIQTDFRHRLVHVGYLDSAERYKSLLRGADLAISTALHEFQGLAMLEAVAAGCVPVVPDRLAYREIYPDRYRYATAQGDEAGAAAALVEELASVLASGPVESPDVSGYDMTELSSAYRHTFSDLAG